MINTRLPGSLFVIVIALCACTAHDAPKTPLSQAGTADAVTAAGAAHAMLGPGAKALLDTGNTLFRKKAYAAALAKYQEAAALAPQHAAPLFGIYMVARATNNPTMADSALAGIRLRNGPSSNPPHSMSDTALKRLRGAMHKSASSG